MIALCIEASHARGLGHLYKALNLAFLLRDKRHPFVVLVNDDAKATGILHANGIDFRTVPLADTASNWEKELIESLGITVWVNDRLDTEVAHARHVKDAGIRLATVDDRGTGAELADIHFAPLLFAERLKGKRVLTGHRYLILNPDIDRYRRVRREIGSIVVSLGGSDTYGVTLKVVEILKRQRQNGTLFAASASPSPAASELAASSANGSQQPQRGQAPAEPVPPLPITIVTGPSFLHADQLENLCDESFIIKRGVASLVEEFSKHDLAITGGGVTPFEANAAGLPCVVVANEVHEIDIGRHLANLGSSRFAGYHEAIDEAAFTTKMDLETMSRAGLEKITTEGAENVFRELRADG